MTRNDDLRSVLTGTAGLSIALLVALVLTVSGFYFSSCRSATTFPDGGGVSPGGSITAAGPCRTCGRGARRAAFASAWSRRRNASARFASR